MLTYTKEMSPKDKARFEETLKNQYIEHKQETERDLNFRLHGVSATRGSSGKQFVGYETLGQFYRGDQWDHDEPPGASQRTDNYCATIVDTFSSLLFDAPVEINCPAQDETDELLEMKAEFKEKLLKKVYDDNDADDIIFPELSKTGSTYGDTFIKGPFLDKNGSESKKDWKIKFYNVENPANIRPIFLDENYKDLYGFIDTTAISPMKCEKLYGKKLTDRGKSVADIMKKYKTASRVNFRSQPNITSQQTYQPMLNKNEYWTDEVMAIFIEDELVDWYWHNWKFVPLQYIKNIYVPNHPYGKSDIEDAIDPQLFYTRVNNDLANALKFLSTINLKGKNLDGMEVLVHGLSKIFNMPDDGELDPIQRAGDPYASQNFVTGRRQAILDVTGTSEALMSSIQSGAISGRSMAMALQSVIRKLNPKIRRYQRALRHLNQNIFKLLEIYYPETKEIIMGDYTNEVSIISTLLRNIIDELNKLQAGVQSLTTTQKNLGIPQPKIEQKRMKADLADPVLGPQVARQPGLLQMNNPEASMPPTEGENGGGMFPSPNQAGTSASPEGAIAGNNQRAAAGATPAPAVNP
jgi:hypothetical protein